MAAVIHTSNNRNWVAKQIRDRRGFPAYLPFNGTQVCQLCATLFRQLQERVLVYYPARPQHVWVHLACAEVVFDAQWCTPRS